MNPPVDLSPVIQWLGDFVDSFDFTRPGIDQSLGRDVANKIVERINERNAQHVDPDGVNWPENSTKEPPKGGYKGWKARKYGIADEPNARTGQMLSIQSLYGRTQIQPKQILMIYGDDAPPDRTAAPTGYMSNADKKTPDTVKAHYAHDGQSVHRIKRRFYEATQEDAVAVVELVQDNLNKYINSIPR